MVEVKNIYKSFGPLKVLKDVSYIFKEGKTTAIIGASGSGKSTLLRCINQLEIIDHGDILVQGKNIETFKHRDLVSKVGMVFQHFNLFSNMTILDNVMYALMKVKKIKKSVANELAIKALESVNIQDKKDAFPSTLSGGQKQRVALARAMVIKPEIMLFDEPTSALDPEMVNEVLDEIKKLTLTGLTNIIVTHEMGFAREIADEIIYMDEGKIIEAGDCKSFFENPQEERTKQFLNKIL
ncbi:Glutamine transport ATP-binding protein GlnQ [Candidatus Izimaplasma bacterium HR1]|jgi:polar amino acid transport system ATP-binding protein|uniref:amino acid ABC transporter ATP-binding protein n=1 Tax=Candidatus Izimoplasma sp. HR1 TaxID=1541959 RepID=UPI0004F80BAC|nr:Glutamine transport ATP-binding protein GlnQ [Candidatus Izimaplasma bacterium HR1]